MDLFNRKALKASKEQIENLEYEIEHLEQAFQQLNDLLYARIKDLEEKLAITEAELTQANVLEVELKIENAGLVEKLNSENTLDNKVKNIAKRVKQQKDAVSDEIEQFKREREARLAYMQTPEYKKAKRLSEKGDNVTMNSKIHNTNT